MQKPGKRLLPNSNPYNLGEIHVARDEKNIAVKCPNCGSGSKKKFSINTDNWNCHCWVCGIKGKNLYSILSKHVDKSHAEEYRDRFLGKTSETTYSENNDESIFLPKGFGPLCLNATSVDPDIKECISYLTKRGLKKSDLWYFKIGTTSIGKFRRRIIIPSFDSFGELNYFASRCIDDDCFPKYLNSKAKKR